MKRILVTGAGGPAGANFVKSLRIAPEKFFISGSDVNSYNLELTDADSKNLLPRCDRQDYIDELNNLITKEDIQFIHPQPDVEVAVISEKREDLRAEVFLPKKETIRLCQDKLALSKILEKKGVPVPKSFSIKNRSGLEDSLEILLELNPKRAWLRALKGAGGRASLPITTAEQGEMWIEYWKKERGLSWNNFMLAEFLPGKEFAFQSLWKDGNLVTSQARERLEYLFGYLTPSGQTSSPTVARTVSREDVNDAASKAVLAIDEEATGVFCVDLKENSSNIPCVTEINAGRFFTTSNFFSEAGINMPYLYIKLAFGEPFKKYPKYNPLPENLYWIRNMDMGHKLVKGDRWKDTR
jgi:carbamoyl-phosphate synthase large subunit